MDPIPKPCTYVAARTDHGVQLHIPQGVANICACIIGAVRGMHRGFALSAFHCNTLLFVVWGWKLPPCIHTVQWMPELPGIISLNAKLSMVREEWCDEGEGVIRL